MIIFIFTICSCIFAAWLCYEHKKTRREDSRISEAFWEREALANSTRNKDISQLPLLKPDSSTLPNPVSTDAGVLFHFKKMQQAAGQPMMDLSQFSNTDLKLAYGVGNFKTLCGYDENYHAFLQSLSDLADACIHAEAWEDAGVAYCAALEYGSLKVSDYTGLANTLFHIGKPEKANALIKEVESGCHPRKHAILRSLHELSDSYR